MYMHHMRSSKCCKDEAARKIPTYPDVIIPPFISRDIGCWCLCFYYMSSNSAPNCLKSLF